MGRVLLAATATQSSELTTSADKPVAVLNDRRTRLFGARIGALGEAVNPGGRAFKRVVIMSGHGRDTFLSHPPVSGHKHAVCNEQRQGESI